MSTPVAIAYPDMATAEKVRQELIEAGKEHLVRLGERLRPGRPALIVLGSADGGDKVIERLKAYGGDVIQTSLKIEEEDRLRATLGEVAAVG